MPSPSKNRPKAAKELFSGKSKTIIAENTIISPDFIKFQEDIFDERTPDKNLPRVRPTKYIATVFAATSAEKPFDSTKNVLLHAPQVHSIAHDEAKRARSDFTHGVLIICAKLKVTLFSSSEKFLSLFFQSGREKAMTAVITH